MKTAIFLFLASVAQMSWAQKQPSFLEYIKKHAPLAVEQMQRYNIPASITLAQGLHESAAGSSVLATKANNHFGIKVGSTWTGPCIEKADDKPNDLFRVYKNTRESYEDHSLFLQQKRYQPLFELSSTDYKGWAYGLKQCGYATNPAYAQILIRIIEDYSLYEYDTNHKLRTNTSTSLNKSHVEVLAAMGIGYCNHNYYVTVAQGESLASIAERTSVPVSRLVKYNELSSNYVLTVGDRIYLKKKCKRAAKELKGFTHVVRAGESMHSISQIYGMRLSTLYKVNKLAASHVPHPGDQLVVR